MNTMNTNTVRDETAQQEVARKGAADALRTALSARRLEVPELTVAQRKIHLGDVSVSTADRLACLLGAPPQVVERDLEEWPEVQRVMSRLGAAFGAATDGGFLDLYFHPDCVRCDRYAVLSLGSIDLPTALRLVTTLRAKS